MYRHNSTIRVREGKCSLCPHTARDQPLIKGLCSNHYQLSLRLKSVEKQGSKEIKEQGLGELVEVLDHVFSKFVRLSYSDENGWAWCFVTGKPFKWNELDAGHFIPRGCMHLRWDIRNVKPQSVTSNRWQDGDAVKFAIALEKENPGIVDTLNEESAVIYKYSRSEINALIKEYRAKVNELLKKISE